MDIIVFNCYASEQLKVLTSGHHDQKSLKMLKTENNEVRSQQVFEKTAALIRIRQQSNQQRLSSNEINPGN